MQMDLIHYDCFGAAPTLLDLVVFVLLLIGVFAVGYNVLRRSPQLDSVAQLRLRRRVR